ncbi:lipocalin-like domain-containing protein [Mycobacterium sp. UM_CSW]|uniref:lipocalin-like domain-containing protein n=1 Tax=Mycobacterium sp. UM_CSW TaxID=1370119 RepID=UPI0004168C93|nr:lipocalin-like domain-containing protein [Mycobacterium sp. UM_CSW]
MLRETILGAWILVTYTEQVNGQGPERHPHGPHPVGLILYTDDGYMSAQIMTPHRVPYDAPAADGGTVEQTVAAASGYLAYSGPYSVDEATGDITHYVTVSLLPNWLDHPQLRHSHFDGDHLTLTAHTPQPDGGDLVSTLIWRRPEPTTTTSSHDRRPRQ